MKQFQFSGESFLEVSSLKLRLLIAIGFVMMVSGCATTVSQTELRNAYFGQPPSSDEKMKLITTYVKARLIDPESLRIQCAEPRKGWVRPFFTDPPKFGYVFACGVNAKNQFGGYTGEKLYVFLFNDKGQQAFANEQTANGPLKKGLEFDFVN